MNKKKKRNTEEANHWYLSLPSLSLPSIDTTATLNNSNTNTSNNNNRKRTRNDWRTEDETDPNMIDYRLRLIMEMKVSILQIINHKQQYQNDQEEHLKKDMITWAICVGDTFLFINYF